MESGSRDGSEAGHGQQGAFEKDRRNEANGGGGGAAGSGGGGGKATAAPGGKSPAEDAEMRRNMETELLLLEIDKTATQFATSRLRDENQALRSLTQDRQGPSEATVSASLGVLIGSREMLRAEVERMERKSGRDGTDIGER